MASPFCCGAGSWCCRARVEQRLDGRPLTRASTACRAGRRNPTQLSFPSRRHGQRSVYRCRFVHITHLLLPLLLKLLLPPPPLVLPPPVVLALLLLLLLLRILKFSSHILDSVRPALWIQQDVCEQSEVIGVHQWVSIP